MSAQHTPGPWYASPYSSIVGIAISGACGVIAGVRGDKLTAEANARLIASAPDLLALAHKYASECGECGGQGAYTYGEKEGRPCPACADICAVIDKAEGRP